MNKTIQTALINQLIQNFQKQVIEKLRENCSNSEIIEVLASSHIAGICKIGLILDKEDISRYFKEVKRRLDVAFDEIKKELKIDE